MEQIERLIQKHRGGTFAVMLSRYAGSVSGKPKSRARYYGGLATIEEARALRAQLEAADPPKRPGRKPLPTKSTFSLAKEKPTA